MNRSYGFTTRHDDGLVRSDEHKCCLRPDWVLGMAMYVVQEQV